jgi:type II secretory pathway pseudopilin PulG
MARIRSSAGFTILEMMIATMIMMAVTGAVFQVMNPSQGTFQAQPEASDLQQRMRVAADSLKRDLIMAGAGSYSGSSPGALYNFFAPVMPYRRGDLNDDPADGVFFRPDTISLLYIPPTAAQTGVNKAMGNGNSQELDVDAQLNCPGGKQNALCGFEDGMRVVIFDVDGSWDVVTITNVQDAALHLQHSGKLSGGSYNSGGAVITQVASHTYYLKEDDDTDTYQLMHYDGAQTDTPVVDNVVKLEFEYFGDPQPPQLIPNKSQADTRGPWTTYGPKPPLLGVDAKAGDEFNAGENCVFMMDDGQQVPRLDVLINDVAEVKLSEQQLTDGPWCPNQAAETRFDADLFRIRHIRVILRVQVALAALRGPAGTLFTKGGTSTSSQRFIPDQEIRFDIAPRNMNLGR